MRFKDTCGVPGASERPCGGASETSKCCELTIDDVCSEALDLLGRVLVGLRSGELCLDSVAKTCFVYFNSQCLLGDEEAREASFEVGDSSGKLGLLEW